MVFKWVGWLLHYFKSRSLILQHYHLHDNLSNFQKIHEDHAFSIPEESPHKFTSWFLLSEFFWWEIYKPALCYRMYNLAPKWQIASQNSDSLSLVWAVWTVCNSTGMVCLCLIFYIRSKTVKDTMAARIDGVKMSYHTQIPWWDKS